MNLDSRRLQREGGFSNYISVAFILPILLAILVGGGYIAKSQKMMATLNHALVIVDNNMKQNGALTNEGQAQLVSYLEKNNLDLSKVYLNATTTTQSFGSRGLEATIGYDFDLYAPGTSRVIWHKYYEVSVPMTQSQLIPGSGADTSGNVPLSSVFSGVQGGTGSGGSGSGSIPVNVATSMTLQTSTTSPVVNAPVIVSGKVYFGSNTAPAGTLVSLSGGGVNQNISTDAAGSYTASVRFTQPGTVQLQGTSGAATASVSLSVQANTPKTILLIVPSTVRVGDSLKITGSVLDMAGNTVMDGTAITISSSTTDIPTTAVTTQAWSFTHTVNKITSLDPITVTASAGAASATKSITVIPGDPKTITLAMSSTDVTAGSTVTFSGQVFGPYGTPPTEGTPVTIKSETDFKDTLPALTTDAAGRFSGTVKLTHAGSHSFYAQTTGSIMSSALTATITAGAPYKVQGMVGTPNPINMGANLSLSGYVSDEYNNLVDSGTSLEISSVDLPSTVSTSVLSGAFNARVTLQKPGIQTLSVKESSGAILTGGSFSINVLPTAAYTLTPTQDLYEIKSGQSIGNVEFTLRDSNGQPVAEKTVEFSEMPEGNTLITPESAVTDSLGRVRTTVGVLTTIGSHTITAAMAGDTNVVGTVGINVSSGSPAQILSNVSPSTTQAWTAQNPIPLPIVSGTVTDTYGNPIVGASVTVSGGYGANVTGTTGANGYYAISIKPVNVGGPYALSFSVTSSLGNFNTTQGSLTVTEPLIVPVDKVLEGTTIAGYTGTMPNMVTADPNGMGAGRSSALEYWTGSGSTVFLKPQKGYYDGIDTWTYYNEPNLIPENIKNGVRVFGVTGTYSAASPHGLLDWTTAGSYSFTVPDGVTRLYIMMVGGGGGGGGGGYISSGYGAGYFYSAGGGGGGQAITYLDVTPGQVLPVVVGAGGQHGADAYGSYGNSSFAGQGQAGGTSSIGSVSVSGGQGGYSERSSYQDYNGIAYGGAGVGYGVSGGTCQWANSGGTWGYNYGVFGGYGGSGSLNAGKGGKGAMGTGSNGQDGRVIIEW